MLPIARSPSAVRAAMSAIDDLTTELVKLPGIGRKTALRLTYHLLQAAAGAEPPPGARRS